MSVVNAFDGEMFAFVKGAPDAVLERCSRTLHSRGQAEIDDDVRARFIKQADEMAGRALRVLGVARRKLQHVPEDPDSDYVEHDLTFLGLIGIIDPPREEVKAAIKRCHRAGIRTVMITGDHQKTAESIACEVGLLDQGERSISGLEIECLDDKQMQDVVRRANVFARVSPKHKIRIVNALRATGEVVAMTGDGVNDAPAVKAADIGIAMGIAGTDVTKEASSMVLSDDNFATIVAAVEEGRAIYANIRKFIRYLLSCNVGEVMVMFLASLLGYPVPLLPIQVLWVNLVTDGLPAIALGLDPPGRDLMAEAPRLTGESIFARGLGRRIIVRGCLIALGSLVMFILSYESGGDLARARTVAFATLVMFQLFHVFECRCERGSVFEVGVLGNKPLLLAVGSSLCMMLLVLYVPKAAAVFSAVRLGAIDWLLIFGVSGLSTLIAGLRHASRR
jgi:Ca2+-transporting ATPase